MENKESKGTLRAVIADDFAQTIAACVEEILPSGHIGIAFEAADAPVADDIEGALGTQKFKISRFSYADDTPPSQEAAEDIVNAAESIRLLVCAGNNIADVVKFAAGEKGVPWILCPSGPDILPAAEPFAVLGWGALAGYRRADAPAAIAADRARMERASGREKAAAYASLYAERLHCAEYECENLLFGRGNKSTTALADVCASALKEGENLAEYSLKAAIERQKSNLKGEGSARRFARIISAVSDDGRSVSENCFVCARVLTEIYCMSLAYTRLRGGFGKNGRRRQAHAHLGTGKGRKLRTHSLRHGRIPHGYARPFGKSEGKRRGIFTHFPPYVRRRRILAG